MLLSFEEISKTGKFKLIVFMGYGRWPISELTTIGFK